MSKIKARLATSYLDKHNEKISLGALQSMVDTINQNIIPVGIEHDPRVYPSGRILNAELIHLNDGEYAIDGEIEIFDESSNSLNDGRELIVKHFAGGEKGLMYDRNFANAELKTIEDISSLLSVKPTHEIKKAVDFISVLTIVAPFILGNIANGLLKDLGLEPYSLLKESLKKLFSTHKNPIGKLILFDFFAKKKDNTQINTQIIVDNPNDTKLDLLFSKGFKAIDKYSKQEYPDTSIMLEQRIVFIVTDNSIRHMFSVTKDGRPIKKSIDIVC